MRVEDILESDRIWCAYALADLEPGFREHCEWRVDGDALLLLYRAFSTPVLFAQGKVEALIAALEESCVYLSVRPPVVEWMRTAGYRIEHETPMWRMSLAAGARLSCPLERVFRLGEEDIPALESLYRDGEPAGEAPDFFDPSMVMVGVFYGVREGGELVAVAGTHIVARSRGVAAIGNVYTRRDFRGRGLGRLVTSAVAARLRSEGLSTIILNVKQSNAAAVHIYERLGFARYCEFREGVAVRIPINR